MAANQTLVDNGTLDKIIVNDDHGLKTLADHNNDNTPNLIDAILRVWDMYLKMDSKQRRDINQFCAKSVPADMQNNDNNNKNAQQETTNCRCYVL